jgi:hypothetical protein
LKKLSIKKSVKRFVENWVDEQADPFASWMFQSVLHWNVLMLIADATFNSYEISFEDICLKINHRVGSRTSIQNIIKVGIEKKFIDKEPSEKDSRRKVLYLSEIGNRSFINFVQKDAATYIYE